MGNTSVAAQAGIATVLLRSRTTGGAITVSASASGLMMGTASVTSSISPTTGTIDVLGARARAAGPGFSISGIGSMLRVRLPRSDGPEQSATYFALYNAEGKIVLRLTLLKREETIPIGRLSRGVYFGRIGGESKMVLKE